MTPGQINKNAHQQGCPNTLRMYLYFSVWPTQSEPNLQKFDVELKYVCVKDCVKGGMTTGGAYQEKVNNLQINAHTVDQTLQRDIHTI